MYYLLVFRPVLINQVTDYSAAYAALLCGMATALLLS